MALAALFATAFMIGLSGAVMPGPLLTVTMTESLRRGWRAALWLVTGHALLELAVVILLALGMHAFMERPGVLRVVGILGGGVLLWMAVGAVRAARRAEDFLAQSRAATTDTPARPGTAYLIFAGAAVSASNPYWLVWWASIGAKYVVMGLEHGRAGLAVFYAGHILSDYAWYLAVGAGLTLGRHGLRPAGVRILFGACAAVLAGFGLFFFLSGVGVIGTLLATGSAT